MRIRSTVYDEHSNKRKTISYGVGIHLLIPTFICVCVFFLIVRNRRSIKFVCRVPTLFYFFFIKSLRPLETRKFTRQIRCCGNIQLYYVQTQRTKINLT